MKKIIVVILFIFITIASQGQKIIIKEPIRFLALGDSYTIGQGVLESDRWPNQLVDSMEKFGYEFEKLKIIAQTGWRTDDLLNAIEKENLSFDYNMVSLLIGVNNQYQGFDFEIYPNDFQKLLDKAIALCGGERSGVFVLSIPDYGYTPFGFFNRETISAEIDKYNETNRKISLDSGVTYIDITPISREAEEKPQYLASDNLHPSGLMYAEWVEEILKDIDLSTFIESSLSDKISGLNIYPNPAINYVRYVSEFPVESIALYNLLGIQVIRQNIDGQYQFDLDVSQLESGVYYYRILLVDKNDISGKVLVK